MQIRRTQRIEYDAQCRKDYEAARSNYREDLSEYRGAIKLAARSLVRLDIHAASGHAIDAYGSASAADISAAGILVASLNMRKLTTCRAFVNTLAFVIPSYLRLMLMEHVNGVLSGLQKNTRH